MPRGGPRPGAGRPRMAAADIADHTYDLRVRQVRTVLQGLDEWDVVKEGIVKHIQDMVGENAACIVDQACQSENAAEEMVRKLEAPEAKRLTKDEALGMLLHLKMSKHQYTQFAKMMNRTVDSPDGGKIIPCYKVVSQHKVTCRPENVAITEVKAQVPLHSLLKHTLERLVKANEQKIAEAVGKRRKRCVFTFCWGYDSATGQKEYKMPFKSPGNENCSDKCLFAAVINPLSLKTEDGIILWENDYPQSSLFIRTFMLEYASETTEYVQRFNHEAVEELRLLNEIEIVTDSGIRLVVKFQHHLTNIDGKIFNILSNTSTQRCPVCKAGQDDFNNVDNIGSNTFAIKGCGREHGVQPLHAWIKFILLLLNISYRLPSQEEGLEGAARRASIRQRKVEIRARCKELWGVTVSGPGVGGSGTSLDGNTSRRLFEDPDRLAATLNLNVDLVRRFKVILLCVNSTQYRLQEDAFEEYAHETYRKYIEHYGWFRMSPSVHKILIHAAEIQTNFEIPIGAASEGGAELLHRIRKDVRLNATRKRGRLEQNQDLMNRLLDLSDPFISSKVEPTLSKFRVRTQLPAEATRLLQTGNAQPSRNRTNLARGARAPRGRQEPRNNDDIVEADDDIDVEDVNPDYLHRAGEDTDYEFDMDDPMDIDT